MNMSDDQLAAIKARVEAATPGPWEWNDYGWLDSTAFGRKEEVMDYAGCGSHRVDLTDEDAEFIAHARSDIPYLLAIIEGRKRV